jgi:hypothetical protein
MMTLSTILKPKKLERSPTLFDPREHDQIHFLGDGTVEIIRDGKVVCTGHCDYTPEPKPLQKRGAPSPEAEKKSGSSNADLPPGARWITVRPNGEGTKGVPLLIREHPDGSASVIAGAGGNLNFLKLGKLKSPEEWKQAARERAADKKRKEAERVAAQSEEEQAAEVEQKEQQQEYHSTKKHENALATIAALDEHGIDHGLTDAHKNALANPPAPGADKADVDEWKKLTREAGRRIKDIHRAYEHKLVVDADARAAARMGDAPLMGNGNLIVENQAHLACNSGGETLAQLQQLPNGQWLARGSGDGPGKVYDNWAAAAREHVRNTAEAESDQGGDRTQDDTFYDPSQWVKQVKDETLPEGFEFKVGAAAAIAQLSQERKDLDRQKKDAEAAIARGEAWQSIKGRYDAGPVRDALDKIDADAKTLQDAVTNDDFLSLVDSAGDGEKLRRHVQVGGYGKLSEIASDILKVNPVSRALIDALGHNEGAKLVAYQIRQALDPMEYDRAVQAQAAYHADTSAKVAAATQKQVEPMLENLRSLHDQMLALEEKAGDSPTPEQQIQIDTLAYDAETLHENIQQTLGIALGQLQASAAMVAALEAKPNTLRFNNSDGASAAVGGVISAKVRADAGKDPTGEESVFDSYGLTPEDYHHFEGPDGKRLQINESGMKKLAVGYNSEDAEAYERAIAIKRGEMDEAHFVPNGFAYRMKSTFSDGITEAQQFDTKLDLAEGMDDGAVEESLKSYIGARVANGENPLDVMSDVRSPEFYMQAGHDPYGSVATQTQQVASNMIARLAGGTRISDKAITDAFQQLGDAEAIKQRRARQTDDLQALHAQKLEQDSSVEAGHRTLAAMPMARVLFKSWENTTGKERKWLRDYAITEVLGQELQAPEKKAESGPAVPDDVAEEQYDLFGNKISAAEAIANPDAEPDSQELSQWQSFSKFMGGDAKAYDAVKDHLRGKFNNKFANAYGAIAGKPLLMGGQNISNVDRLLLAKMPEGKRQEMMEFMRNRQASDVAKVRSRSGGKFASEMDGEWLARYEELKGDNRQISLLSADTGRSTSKTDYQRTALGAEAEDNLHRAMQQVIPNFEQVNGPVDIIKEVNWSGGTAHATKQRALKFLEANKNMWMHFAAGCVHGSTILKCAKTGIEQSFWHWWVSGDRPWVNALDQESGAVVQVEASAVFAKTKPGSSIPIFEKMFLVKLENGDRVTVTGGHRFLSRSGWQPLGLLQVGDEIAIAGSADSWARIDSILGLEGTHTVFDITVPAYENYEAEGIRHHNSGKSAIMLGQFTHLHSQGKVKKMVVAVPSSIVGQFCGEAASFLEPGKYNYNANLGWNREQRLGAIADPDCHIHITTRESLTNDILHLVEKHHGVTTGQFQNEHDADSRKNLVNSALRSEGIDPSDLMMAVDEAHDLLSATGEDSSKRSMVLGALGHNTPYSVFATGSPMKNNIDEVYHALHMVAPSKFSDKAKFKAEYGANTDVSRRALQRAIAPYMYAAGTKPKDKSGRTLKMNEKQPKIPVNDHISKGRAAILEDTKTVGAYLSARTKDLKAQGITPTTEHYNEAWNDPAVRAAVGRLASGDTWGKMTEDQQKAAIGGQIRAVGAMKMSAMYRLFHLTPFEQNEKAQWTVNQAKENLKKGKPGIIFTKSSRAAKMLMDEMAKQGIKVGLIDGSLSSTQKDEVRGKFQSANPEYNYLVLTDAAQTGLNLTAAKSVLHYDCPDTNKAKEQRDARSLRLKQTEDVEVYVPGYDVPEERISLARVQRKAKTGNPLQSKAELVDDSGLASRIAQMRSRPEAA